MEKKKILSFDDTASAFAYKSDIELKKAKFIFTAINYNWLVKAGTAITPLIIRLNLFKVLIRKTIFEQFVGGETLSETKSVLNKLNQYGVKAIIDYGAEGKNEEKSFNDTLEEFLKLLDFAATQPDIPFISIKITGLARFELLEKLNLLSSININEVNINIQNLSEIEKAEWEKVLNRISSICSKAIENKIGILIDAEETWIQNTIDAIALTLMMKYNHQKAVVYNTIQFYRNDRLDFLATITQIVQERSFKLGLKIVRGAYMEKERARATAMNYESPIHVSKVATDKDFNTGLDFSLQHHQTISLVIATHNELSNLAALDLIKKNNIEDKLNIHFSQLYGMSDHITFNLSKAGYSVSKYLPYGPLEYVIPYLMRRAQENTSVSGQTGRELYLLNKELKRRSLKGKN